MKNKYFKNGFSFLVVTLLFAQISASLIQFSLAEEKEEIKIANAYPSLSFERPVDYQIANDNTNRIFLVEQAGKIHVFENSQDVESTTIFLDITSKVSRDGNEEGLLGLAFHPEFDENGLFYIYYSASDPRRSILSQFEVQSENPDKADFDSELILMEISQPRSNHNGGQIVFGPDGYLYITLGDGGGAGDPDGNGQDRTTLLGTILRIDVDNKEGEKNYAIPDDNPYVNNDQGYREEIYAYGLRNPWRISFDTETNWLWAGDVGQGEWEEIDIIEKGGNYGWNIKEGTHCYDPPTDCNDTGLIDPVWEYDHSVGYSITGGYVYHGSLHAELQDMYIYGDFVAGQIWGLKYDGINPVNNSLLINSGKQISSFGVDQTGEIYILAFDGKIYTFYYDDLSATPEETPFIFVTVITAMFFLVQLRKKNRK